jgi:hypothetical protein
MTDNLMGLKGAEVNARERRAVAEAIAANNKQWIERIDRMLNNSTWQPDYHCNCDIVLNALWHTLKQSLETNNGK